MRAPALPLIVLGLLACKGGNPESDAAPGDGEPTDAVYGLDHLLRVELELPADDWDTLRDQSRSIEEMLMVEGCQDQPFESPFTWFEARATIDGEVFERIDVRKKGFVGSLSEEKPGLKLDLAEYVDGATFEGARRLTLNNSVSDASFVRQCLAYSTFTDVGLPASRCSLAQVTVNGEDLGIYVNVEPIKKPMLRRHFDSDEGNLYEGTLSDFREGWTGTLEKKTNEDEDDWSDVEALVDAVQADEDELLEALDAVVDLDQFFRFWATEVLVQHGDGYAGNTNNFYVYADPSDGRFRFLPWGVDMTLGVWEEGDEEVADEWAAVSIYASSVLPWRLYNHPEGRERYEQALQDVLSEGWDEDRLLDRLDTMAALIEPELSGTEWAAVEARIEGVGRLVEGRRGTLEQALEDGLPDWPWEPRDSYCFVPTGVVDVSFSTTWGTIETADPFSTGSSELYLDFGEGTVLDLDNGTAVAGSVDGETAMYLPAWLSPTEAVLLYVGMDEDSVEEGALALDLSEHWGGLFYIDTSTMEEFVFVSYVVGDVVFAESGTEEGDVLEGTLTGQFMNF